MSAEFRHPAVRDLAWVIGSPPLLETGRGLYGTGLVTRRWCRLAFYDRLPWLRELDDEPAALEQWLAERRSPLLGYYFEALIEFWLRHWPKVEFIAARAQVRREGRGIGEFDFLFRDRERQAGIHWESAVKFFLRHRDGEDHYHWLGPNPRDTFDGKVAKVFRHQLRMGERPEAAELLTSLGLSHPRPEAFIKGYLFYPADRDWRHPVSVPASASTDHLRGWWTRAGRPRVPMSGRDSRWMVLERLHWLAPARSDGEELMDRPALDRLLEGHLRHSGRPLLVAELSPGRRGYSEVSRGFIVPDHWPGRGQH